MYIGASLIAQLAKIRLQCRRHWFNSWVRKIHWRRDRLPTSVFLGFPCGSAGRESICNAGHLQCRRPQFDSWVRKIHWRRDRLPTSVFLGFPCGSAGKECACNAEDLGSNPRLGDFLEEGIAMPSSILAWRIPWTEEPGGLQSIGSKRVRHD